jgi:hypothetical protein
MHNVHTLDRQAAIAKRKTPPLVAGRWMAALVAKPGT